MYIQFVCNTFFLSLFAQSFAHKVTDKSFNKIKNMSKILVVGSSNIDLTARVDHLPVPGETVTNAEFAQTFGGKGANQAVAAARLGGEVTFVTMLGHDSYASQLKNQFKTVGIEMDYVLGTPSAPTGTAFIFVSAKGENCIAVAPGANAHLTPEKIDLFRDAIASADIVVMQAEIPYETVRTVAVEAAAKGKKVLYNPAPACDVDDRLIECVTTMVLNEVEASVVSGIQYDGNNLDEIADSLIARGVENVIITLGGDGVYMKNSEAVVRIPSHKVNVVDTVAAGDTFCGALATKGVINKEALEFANAAAAIAVTRPGAQTSIPTLEEVNNFLFK